MPFLTNPDKINKVDDCSLFILTNINGLVKVDEDNLNMLENEDVSTLQIKAILLLFTTIDFSKVALFFIK